MMFMVIANCLVTTTFAMKNPDGATPKYPDGATPKSLGSLSDGSWDDVSVNTVTEEPMDADSVEYNRLEDWRKKIDDSYDMMFEGGSQFLSSDVLGRLLANSSVPIPETGEKADQISDEVINDPSSTTREQWDALINQWIFAFPLNLEENEKLAQENKIYLKTWDALAGRIVQFIDVGEDYSDFLYYELESHVQYITWSEGPKEDIYRGANNKKYDPRKNYDEVSEEDLSAKELIMEVHMKEWKKREAVIIAEQERIQAEKERIQKEEEELEKKRQARLKAHYEGEQRLKRLRQFQKKFGYDELYNL